MWYLWIVAVAGVVLLWALNEHLSGRLKDATSGILIFGALGLVIASFVVSGWKVGLASLASAPVSAFLLYPLARFIGRHSSGYSDPSVADYPQRQWRRLKRVAPSGKLIDEMERQATENQKYEESAVSKACRISSIQDVLDEFDADRKDLAALYKRIELQMLTPPKRIEALCNPHMVRFFLEHSEPSDTDEQYSRNLDSGAHLQLTLWADSVKDCV